MIIDFADIARETIKYTMDDIAREMMKYIMDDVLNEVQKNKSYVGMIIASRTLDTEEKVKNFYGGEKWERIRGRTLVGAADDFPIGTEGGEKEHVLSWDEMPRHDHKTTYDLGCLGLILKWDGKRTDDGRFWGCPLGDVNYGSGGAFALNCLRTDHSGWGAAHNNMPPYKVCYIWERIE